MIQELLGHASLSTTQRYVAVEPTQILEIYNLACCNKPRPFAERQT